MIHIQSNLLTAKCLGLLLQLDLAPVMHGQLEHRSFPVVTGIQITIELVVYGARDSG